MSVTVRVNGIYGACQEDGFSIYAYRGVEKSTTCVVPYLSGIKLNLLNQDGNKCQCVLVESELYRIVFVCVSVNT